MVQRGLGLHAAISRVQGGRLQAKKEIRVASPFKAAAPQLRLCRYMLPDYRQLGFDPHVYLTWRGLPSTADANRRR